MPRSWLRDTDIQNGDALFCFIIMITVMYIKYLIVSKNKIEIISHSTSYFGMKRANAHTNINRTNFRVSNMLRDLNWKALEDRNTIYGLIPLYISVQFSGFP